MLEGWLWLGVFGLSTGAIAFIAYLLWCDRTNSRILRLESEIAQVRIREEDKEKKLGEIFSALTSLQRTTEERLHRLQERIDEFLASAGRTE
jgi:predicted  nucleic acid-binding Zn-ribbon protein